MPTAIELDTFLEEVMQVSSLRFGGASAGIIGAAGEDNDIVNRLKKVAIAFAYEYHLPKPSRPKLLKLEEEIAGYLQILQLNYTMSPAKADKLIRQLQKLTDTTTV